MGYAGVLEKHGELISSYSMSKAMLRRLLKTAQGVHFMGLRLVSALAATMKSYSKLSTFQNQLRNVT